MAGKTYVQLHRELRDLIMRGVEVANPLAGTPAVKIKEWTDQARSCLAQLKDLIPKEISAFDHFLRDLEFKVPEQDEQYATKSAYTPHRRDFLVDFRFENLRQINGILKFAAKKVVDLVNTNESSYKGKYFDARVLKAARTSLNVTQEQLADWFGVDERTIKRWEAGQDVMRGHLHRRLKTLIHWAEQGHDGLPPKP